MNSWFGFFPPSGPGPGMTAMTSGPGCGLFDVNGCPIPLRYRAEADHLI